MRCLLVILCTLMPTLAQAADVNLVVSGLRNSNGYLLVSLFDQPDGFPDQPKKARWKGRIRARSGQMGVSLGDLPPGRYAIAAIHDENNNRKLDTGAFGIPLEGFGFSNNPTIRTGAPDFKECAVEVREPSSVIRLRLNHF